MSPPIEHHLRDRLDADTQLHWDRRDLFGRRRISLFARGLYRRGLLGRFIGVGHLLARLYGADPRDLVAARSVAEQKNLFDNLLAPLFDKRLVRWLTSQKMSLFGLGIPPAQYEALAAGAGMAGVLRERLERLACGFPMSENYFAWQAFARCYSAEGPLPLYLARANFPMIRERGRPRAGRAALGNRTARGRAGGKLRRLCSSRCAGLDDRRAADCAVARDQPYRARRRAGSSSAPRASRRSFPAGFPMRSSPAGPTPMTEAGSTRPGTGRRPMAASTSTSSADDLRPRRHDGPRLSAPAPRL